MTMKSSKLIELLQEQEKNNGTTQMFHIDPITKVASILMVVDPVTEKSTIILNTKNLIETLQKHEEQSLKKKFPMLKNYSENSH